MNIENDSYIERCILSLPPGKQEAARKAFSEFGDGDGSTFSRLLVVLEATSSFAKTIPQELSEVSQQVLKEWDERRAETERVDASRAKAQEESLRSVIEQQLPALGKALSVDRLAQAIERQNATLGRVERSMARLRTLRISGVLGLLGISAVLSATAVIVIFRQDYLDGQSCRTFLDRLAVAGVELSVIRKGSDCSVLVVKGPRFLKGTEWRRDAAGLKTGAEFVFEEGAIDERSR